MQFFKRILYFNKINENIWSIVIKYEEKKIFLIFTVHGIE